MEAIKFTLSGSTAFFKKPEFNTYYYFTYGQIHRVALLGLFGAMLGLGGYNKQKNTKTEYPEFYSELQDLKIAVIPNREKGYFPKKMQVFNNSTGFASFEAGGNLIVKEQWLEQPSWDILVLLDGNKHAQEIANRLLARESVYTLYLGKNDHLANINDIEKVQVLDVESTSNIIIASLCIKDNVKILKEESGRIGTRRLSTDALWQYEEDLPKGLMLQTNHYELERFLLTNSRVELSKNKDSFLQFEGTDNMVVQFI